MSTDTVRTPQSPDDDGHRAPASQLSHPVLRAVALVENLLMVTLLVATVATVLGQVFFRYVLSRPLSWSTEIATDLLVYVAFVGFAIAVRDNAHVAMRLFERRLGAGARRWLRLAELLVLGAVLVCLGIGGATYAVEQRDVVSQSGVPVWATFLPLPIGAVLGCVHIVVEIVALVRGAQPPDAARDEDEPAAAVPLEGAS